MKDYTAFIVLLALLLAGCGRTDPPRLLNCDPDEDGIIEDNKFVDPKFLTAVKKRLKIEPNEKITVDMAIDMFAINIASQNISDISGMECFVGLQIAYMGDNAISDLNPLYDLPYLGLLDLGENDISDITAVASLHGLISADLHDNEITDIGQLDEYTPLKCLYLEDNSISDIASLANLEKLAGLSIARNQISDISPLIDNQGLGSGDWVYLSENEIPSSQIDELKTKGVKLGPITDSWIVPQECYPPADYPEWSYPPDYPWSPPDYPDWYPP